MLENIKLVLGITDNSKDSLIQYYINSYQNIILAYCNILELPVQLESVIERLIISKMSGNDGTIKSETIGDYRVDYNTSEEELTPYIKILNRFRRVKFV